VSRQALSAMQIPQYFNARMLAYPSSARHCSPMRELIRTPNIVVISALQATLRSEGIEVFEFDGPIADTLSGFVDFPRRLFVDDDDYDAARAIMIELCPEEVETI